MKCKLFAVGCSGWNGRPGFEGAGRVFQPVPSPETQRELPPLLALPFLNCCGSTDIPGRGGSSRQAQRSDTVPGELPVTCSLLRVILEISLNAPAAPDQGPSQLNRKPLHSQLLETARERLKVHVPRLCKTEIPVASPFGPWTAAMATAAALPLSCHFSRGFSEIFQCLLRERGGAALAPQRSSNHSPLAEGSATSKQLICSFFLGPNLKSI